MGDLVPDVELLREDDQPVALRVSWHYVCWNRRHCGGRLAPFGGSGCEEQLSCSLTNRALRSLRSCLRRRVEWCSCTRAPTPVRQGVQIARDAGSRAARCGARCRHAQAGSSEWLAGIVAERLPAPAAAPQAAAPSRRAGSRTAAMSWRRRGSRCLACRSTSRRARWVHACWPIDLLGARALLARRMARAQRALRRAAGARACPATPLGSPSFACQRRATGRPSTTCPTTC